MKCRSGSSVLLLCLTACISQHIRVSVPEETTTDLEATVAGPGGIRGVHVRCTPSDTIFEKDGRTVIFLGHAAYRGEIGERFGRLIVGDVTLTYTDDDLEYHGPLARGCHQGVPRGWAAEIDQSGASRVR